jgi:hypothetical protein
MIRKCFGLFFFGLLGVLLIFSGLNAIGYQLVSVSPFGELLGQSRMAFLIVILGIVILVAGVMIGNKSCKRDLIDFDRNHT